MRLQAATLRCSGEVTRGNVFSGTSVPTDVLNVDGMDVQHGIVTTHTWIASQRRFLSGRVDAPRTPHVLGALIVAPSFGRESVASFRAVRALAVSAARRGFVAVSFTFSGIGDSSPVGEDVDLRALWVNDVENVIEFAHTIVPEGPVNVLGFRLGAAAVAQAAVSNCERKILWEPVSGRSFLAQQKVLRAIVSLEPSLVDGVEVPGGYLTTAQAHSIRSLSLDKGELAHCTLRVEQDREVVHSLINFNPLARIPYTSIAAILDGLAKGKARQSPSWPVVDAITVAVGGTEVLERRCLVGPHGLSGVLTIPAGQWRDTTVAFTAMGVEQSQGPGDLWVALSRRLAVDGYVTLRSDRRMIGEALDVDSPTQPIPYSDTSVQDVAEQVALLSTLVPRSTMAAVGVCAGAYSYLRAAALVKVKQVIALNAIHWNPDTRVYEAFYDPPAADGQPGGGRRRVLTSALRHLPARFPIAANFVSRFANRSEFVARLLRVVPKGTDVVFVFGRDEVERFGKSLGWAAIGARAVRGGSTVVRVDEALDHSLVSEASRRRIGRLLLDVIEHPEAHRSSPDGPRSGPPRPASVHR